MSVKDTTIQKFKAMILLQEQMNSEIDPNWRNNNNAWYRAIWLEVAEMVDHFNSYKWWKAHNPNIPEVMTELVDIAHFNFSLLLQEQGDNYDAIAKQLAESYESVINTPESDIPEDFTDFNVCAEHIARMALNNHKIDMFSFTRCMILIGMDLDALYKRYIGKNSLNFLRQKFGYKQGTYIKIWHGKEYNEVLHEILEGTDVNAHDFAEQIATKLEQAYLAIIKE